jgi:hypothetical protein
MMRAAMTNLDAHELATQFKAIVEPEIRRYWIAQARALTSPALDPETLAMWEESPPTEPLLAKDDLTVMAKTYADGTAAARPATGRTRCWRSRPTLSVAA